MELKDYLEEGSVSGIDFSIDWESTVKHFIIHFPQINRDLFIRSQKPKNYKKNLDFFKQEALREDDINNLIKKVKDLDTFYRLQEMESKENF